MDPQKRVGEWKEWVRRETGRIIRTENQGELEKKVRKSGVENPIVERG